MISLHLFCDNRETREYFYAEALIMIRPGLIDCIHVEVYEAPNGQAFYVKSHFDIRHRERGTDLPQSLSSQWNRSRRFDTLEEASREAADLWAECLRVAQAYWCGEPIRDPGEMVMEAWYASAEHAALFAKFRAARELEMSLGYDTPAEMVASREASEQRRQAERDIMCARDEWVRAQDWRAHRDFGAPAYTSPERGQLVLLGCA